MKFTQKSDEYSGVWICAEQTDGKIEKISYELLTRGIYLAQKRNCPLSAIVFGYKIPEEELRSLIACGADKVIYVDAPELSYFLPETYANCMKFLIDKYKPEIIISGATANGRTLMPYLAIKAETGLTADCTELDIEEETGNLLQTRPAIGGNIMATIKCEKFRPQMATIRPHSTKPAQKRQIKFNNEAIVRILPPQELLSSRISRASFTNFNEEDKGLQDAEIVVCVGKGIKKPENIPLIRAFADSIGAVLGATREVVDRGWLSYPHQIGLSGKTISPKLYIGIGVSGSIQHLAGMQTAKNIIAVNSDPDAQIFKVADLGLVGDLFEIIPLLTAKLKNSKLISKK